VTQVYPAFGVGDAELTKRMTMKNIVCACTGIPYDNVGTVFEYAGLTAENALLRLKDVKPTTGFGETFQYSNTMLAAGGFIAAHALHPKKPMIAAYEEALKAKVLDPLEMKATTFDPRAVKQGEYASPHDRTAKFDMTVTPFTGAEWITPLNPGGGAWSNVRDITKYLQMELGKGKTPAGKQVVSEANILERRKPQGRSGDKTSYGLALSIETAQDIQVYGHNGGLWGYSSSMFFLPEHGVGAVMLANTGYPSPLVYAAFRRKLFEILFDGRDEAREDLKVSLKVTEEDLLMEMGKVDPAPDKAWLDRLAGTYEHALYGKITIKVEGNRGVFDAGEWKAFIGRKKEDDGVIKVALTTPPHLGWPELVVKEADGQITLHLEDGQRKVVFEPVKKGARPPAKTTELKPGKPSSGG
jgi:CubicO group peptidase (beta-lactamase class C family)